MANTDYTNISKSLGLKLVNGHAFSQSQVSQSTSLDIGNGVCRALVILWLQEKKKAKINQNFWNGSGINSTIVNASITLQAAIDLQKEYASVFSSTWNTLQQNTTWVPDVTTGNELKKSSIIIDTGNMTASAQYGFGTLLPNDEPEKIAEKIANSGSRFDILSISGTMLSNGNRIGHSIGLYRELKHGIGKSKYLYLFDPNIGEFEVKGKQDMEELLKLLSHTPAYNTINWDKYVLWTYN